MNWIIPGAPMAKDWWVGVCEMRVYPVPNDSQDRYIKKITKLMEEGLIQKGDVWELDVAHDDWCKMAPCSCDPDIYLEGVKIA